MVFYAELSLPPPPKELNTLNLLGFSDSIFLSCLDSTNLLVGQLLPQSFKGDSQTKASSERVEKEVSDQITLYQEEKTFLVHCS